MSRELHNRAFQILEHALEMKADERAAYVDKECGGNPELRAEVDSLLSHHRDQTLLSPSKPPTSPLAKPRRRFLFRGSGGPRSPAIDLTRLLLWLAVATTLLMLLVGLLTYRAVRNSLRANLAGQLQTVLNADVAAMEHWLVLNSTDAAAWAKDDDIQRIVGQLVARWENVPRDDAAAKAAAVDETTPLVSELNDLFDPVLSQPGSIGFSVISPRGVNVGSLNRELIGSDIAEDGRYLAALLKNESVVAIPSRIRRSAVGIRRAEDVPMIAFASPVRKSGGDVAGVLAFGFEAASEFTEILSIARVGQTGETYAFDDQAILLSNLRDEQTLRKVGLLEGKGDEQSALRIQIRDPGGNLANGFRAEGPVASWPRTKLASMAIAGQSGTDVTGYRNYRGIPVVGAWTWLDNYGFGIGTEMEVAEAYRPLRFVSSVFLGLAGLSGLLALTAFATSVMLLRSRRRYGEVVRLGAYMLEDLIGQGGMGKVYRASHALLKRPAAVKLLTNQNADPDTAARFEREVQLTCQLTHPNTVQIYDFGLSEDGTFYYAMEYLPGINLDTLVKLEIRVPAERVIYILLQAASSIRDSHMHGVVHRDLKPANMMLCERGGIWDFVKVLDFGIAKAIDRETDLHLTKTQAIAGTPQYMAPERFLEPGIVDAASDIYALAAVGFYLLTGRHVASGVGRDQLLQRLLHEDGPAPSSITGVSVPDELDQLIQECLRRDPRSRPNVHQLCDRLSRLASIHPWTQDQARERWQTYALPQMPTVDYLASTRDFPQDTEKMASPVSKGDAPKPET